MATENQLPHWSLEELLPGGIQTLDNVLAEIEKNLKKFEAYRPRLSTDMPLKDFLDILHIKESLNERVDRVYAYAYLLHSENTQDPAALSLQDRIDDFITAAENRVLFFSLWFKSLPDEAAERFIAADADLGYYLESIRRLKPYTLSEAEEKIINIKDMNGTEGLVRIYGILTDGFSFNLTVDGEVKKLTRDGLGTYFHHPSADVRQAAYQELYRVYKENRIVLAQIYAFLVRDWRAEGIDLRGYSTPISISNLNNDLPDAVVDTLLAVCRQNTGLFQRYFKLKARLLGMERLRRYDIYAPIARSEKKIDFDAAVPLIMESFQAFSPQMAQAAGSVLQQGHLDAQVRKGKRGGAFCYSVTPKIVPWVLVNYTGILRNVPTLAHELGHATHTILSRDHSVLTFHAPLPLAETASVFAEMLVTDRLLKKEADPLLQRDLLMTILDDAYVTVQRQAFIAMFEKDSHDMISSGCTSDELSQLYLKNLTEQFGDSLTLSDEFAWEWTLISHIYNSPFYTYAYCFGQLLVLSLYQQYMQEGENFVPRYLKLLSYGGSASPQTILKEAGFDIVSPEFWQGGYSVLQSKLNYLEQITTDM